MLIITVDDPAFQDLLSAWADGQVIGQYQRNGKTQLVCATSQFVIIRPSHESSKFAVKPARGIAEATSLATQLLRREEERGNLVEFY